MNIIKDIEDKLGLRTYPMIANRVENHDKMIDIIAEILDLSYESTPLIDSLVEKSQLLEESIQIKKEEKIKVNSTIENLEDESSSSNNFNIYYSEKKHELKEDISDMIYKERLLALLKGKKSIKIDYIKRKVKLKLIRELPPEGMWYGRCVLKKNPIIEVYHRNLSTEDISTVAVALKKKGLSKKLIQEVIDIYNKVGKEDFFEIYNQSGMDHELIGHLYNCIKHLDHGERGAD